MQCLLIDKFILIIKYICLVYASTKVVYFYLDWDSVLLLGSFDGLVGVYCFPWLSCVCGDGHHASSKKMLSSKT